MFRTLANLVPKDQDYPERTHTLMVRSEFLDDTIYDRLPYEFHQERTPAGEYIPIAQRAPSVRYALCQVVVNDSISFLFAEGRWPSIDVENGRAKSEAEEDDGADSDEDTLSAIVKDTRLNEVMLEAAQRGSVGSVVVWVRVLAGRLFFEALPTIYLTPTFKADAPDVLQRVREQYKVKGAVLRDRGYPIQAADDGTDFWFRREWDDRAETWFVPWKVGEKAEPRIDVGRSVIHSLGFVPMVWVKNLPGGDGVDGACTFRLAIPSSIEINYQLSQSGRGLKYSSSPTLMIKGENFPPNRQHVVGDALIVPPDGDAELLEISGDAAHAVIEYVQAVRKLALESVGGSRADSDKLSAATSGRAMELMNQALINLADKLRASYGEGALLKLLKMVAVISRKMSLVDSDGEAIRPISEGAKIKLVWPRWFSPTADDRQADATALATLTGAAVLSKETAVNALASDYDIEDVAAELARLKGDADDEMARQIALKPPAPAANLET